MQLWKKNFIVTFSFFTIALYIGLFVMISVSFKSDLNYLVKRAMESERGIVYTLQSAEDLGTGDMKRNIGYVSRRYEKAGILLRVRAEDMLLADNIIQIEEPKEHVQIITHKGGKYIYMKESAGGQNQLEITYLENIQGFYEMQNRKFWGMAMAGILISAVIGLILYAAMKKIYRPVNQIAHELRTPLTGIQGYAQYIMMGNISEEDRFFAARQIVSSVGNMKDVIDNLLIMGNVKEGKLTFVPVDAAALLGGIKQMYPEIELQIEQEAGRGADVLYVEGEPTLIRCLLENLISNAVNAGGAVKVTADREKLSVRNAALFEKKEEKEIKPHGYGLAVCQDIAALHRWKLTYESSEKDGTKAELLWGKERYLK